MSEYVASTMWGEVKRTLFTGEWGIVIMSVVGFMALLALFFNPELSMIKSPSNYEMLGNRAPFEEFSAANWRTLKPVECTRDNSGYCIPNFYVK